MTHLPDICLIAPVVHGDGVIAYAACIAHHQDIGGKTPGSLPTDSTDIFQEGLRIPPIKLYEAGRRSDVAYAFIERNVRLPKILLGDLGAQLASLHVGKERLAQLIRAHGPTSLAAYMRALLDRAERLTRQAIARIRPGTYTFEDYLDDDGVNRHTLVRIRATITIEGSELHISFTGSSPQLKGPLNADKSAVMSAIYFVVKAITDPGGPTNGGCFRPLHIDLPEATVVNPRAPAPVNGRTITMKRITDALLGALVQAMPERIPAAPCGSVRVAIFGGTDEASGQTFVCSDFSTGGTGGQPARDGVDSLETDIANTMNIPAESLELNYPIRVRNYRLWQDSAGSGLHRGGLGTIREIEVLRGEVTMTLREDRHHTQAWGLYGGGAAPKARAQIARIAGSTEEIPSKGVFTLFPGDRVCSWVAGGAGYGDPLERDPTSVRDDVMDGKISVDAAREQYGVLVNGAEIDREATQRARKAMRAERGHVRWIYDRGDQGRM
jgi:N-methylhydantoinase B